MWEKDFFMVLDSLSQKEKQKVTAGFAVAVILALFVGYAGATYTSTGVSSASKSKVQKEVQSMMDAQTQKQRQQLQRIASSNSNYTSSDLSINAQVTGVEQSRFKSLYKVIVSVTGKVPSRTKPGTTRSLNQKQTLYISKDGRYLFRKPTDLKKQTNSTRSSAPTSGN